MRNDRLHSSAPEVDLANEFRASSLGWQATLRILIAISPPETGWDRAGDTYSTIGEIKSLQDHESLPKCEVCEKRYLALPG